MPIVNAFEETLDDLRPHNGACPGLNGRMVVFDNLRKIPPVAIERGGVLLIAGLSKVGKSVITHQMLHECPADRVAIDLFPLTGEKNATGNGLTTDEFRRIFDELIDELVDYQRLRGLTPTSGAELKKKNGDPVRWYRRLGKMIEGKNLLVRLPNVDSSGIERKAIVDDLRRYASAAIELNNSLFLYEYSYANDFCWAEVEHMLQESKDDVYGHVHKLPVPGLTSLDGWEFTDRRIKSTENQESYDVSGDAYLEMFQRVERSTSGSFPLTAFNTLGFKATEQALADGKSRVEIDDFRAAALGMIGAR